jgi:cytochrome P450
MPITDGSELIDSHAYARTGYPHALWARLRRESPLHWCEPPVVVPFYAVTRHAHICEISKRPDLFLNGKGIIPASQEVAARIKRGEKGPFDSMQTIITMDPPKHRKFRKVASPWFTPHAIARLDSCTGPSSR